MHVLHRIPESTPQEVHEQKDCLCTAYREYMYHHLILKDETIPTFTTLRSANLRRYPVCLRLTTSIQHLLHIIRHNPMTLLRRVPTVTPLISTSTPFLQDAHSPRDIIKEMLRIPTHPLRRAKRIRTIRDARIRAHIPKRLKPRVRAQHPVPDPAELRKRDVQLRALALVVPSRVDAVAELMQPREDGLDERVARGGVRAAAVDVRDEEGARVRGRVGERADLGKDDLCGGLEVRLAVGCDCGQCT